MGRRERTEDYFRKRLRAERESREWSQAHMAELLSNIVGRTHATTIAKIEAGDRSVRIDEATAIADIFEVSLDSLLGRKAGVENDPIYPIRALQEKAQRSVWDVGVIYRAFRDRFLDLGELEFDGHDNLKSEGKRALLALDEAQRALWEVAGFELPDGSLVQVRPAVVQPLKGIESEKES
jgi:transcriptional regulator with XRE-family HTH domain